MQIKQYVTEKKESVIQNLTDADCPQEVIKQFMENAQENKESQALQVLEKHRKTLLERVHKEEKYIDCLDYLVYMLKR